MVASLPYFKPGPDKFLKLWASFVLFFTTEKRPLRPPKKPIVSCFLFIFTLILNSIQYREGSGTIQTAFQGRPWNAFLYPFMVLGIDTFLENLANGILTLFVAFGCLAITESYYLSHSQILFFILIDTMFKNGQWSFLNSFCLGEMDTEMNVMTSSYCCSSFLFMASIGLLLAVIQKHAFGTIRSIFTSVILFFWLLAFLNDYLFKFESSSGRLCESFSWHAMNFVFGVICGIVLD